MHMHIHIHIRAGYCQEPHISIQLQFFESQLDSVLISMLQY